jgi:hypothetical protein
VRRNRSRPRVRHRVLARRIRDVPRGVRAESQGGRDRTRLTGNARKQTLQPDAARIRADDRRQQDKVPLSATPGTPINTTDTTARWRRIDGCDSQTQTAQEGPVSETTWNRCNDGTSVALYVVQGGTHQWPGSAKAIGADAQFDAADAIWRFFAAQPRVSPTTPQVRVSAIAVKRRPRLSIVVSAIAFESSVHDPGNAYYKPIQIQTAVRTSTGHVIAHRVLDLTKPRFTGVVPLPRDLKAGLGKVSVVVTDSYGRHLAITKSLRLSAAG